MNINQLTKEEKDLLLGMLNEDIPILNEAISDTDLTHELHEKWIQMKDLEVGIVNKLEAEVIYKPRTVIQEVMDSIYLVGCPSDFGFHDPDACDISCEECWSREADEIPEDADRTVTPSMIKVRAEIQKKLDELEAIDDDFTILERLAQIEILKWVRSL